jgi:hypothetical protein
MPKKVFEIKDFTAGLNAYSDPRDIGENEFAQSWNVNTSKKGVAKNGGSLVESVRNLPHTNTKISQGYGLFATGVDYDITSIDGEFSNGYDQGTLQTAYDDEDTTECLRNGDFSSTSDWDESGDFTLANPVTYSHTGGNAGGSLFQNNATGSGWAHNPTAAKMHRLTFTIASVSTASKVTSVTLKGGDGYLAQKDVVLFATGTNNIANGTYDVLFASWETFVVADKFQIDVVSSDSCSFSIDDISVKQVNAVHLASDSTHTEYNNYKTDDYFNNHMITIDTGTGLGQTRRIVDYTGATKVALLDSTFGTNPNASSTYKIFKWVGDGANFGDSGREDYIDSTGASSFSTDNNDGVYGIADELMLRTKVSSITTAKSKDLGYITCSPSSSATYELTGILANNTGGTIAITGSSFDLEVNTVVATEGNILNRRVYFHADDDATRPVFGGICTAVDADGNTLTFAGGTAVAIANDDNLYVDAVSAEHSTTIGALTLNSGVRYTLTFYCYFKNLYHQFVSDAPYGERVPFIQLYSDSVTDGTNTGLYLFDGEMKGEWKIGPNSTYNYSDNITHNYVDNGDFEDGVPSGNGWTTSGSGITYTEETTNTYGGDGKSLKINATTGFSIDSTTIGPNSYFYQDLTLNDNQWYNLSFVYRADNLNTSVSYAIIDRTASADDYVLLWKTIPSTGVDSDNNAVGYRFLGEDEKGFLNPTKFFVQPHSTPGNARTIRIAFSTSSVALTDSVYIDGITVNKSFPDLLSIKSKNESHFSQLDQLSWGRYQYRFTVPSGYDNATDWVLRLHAGTFGFQDGATHLDEDSVNSQIVNFDEIRLSSEQHDNLIFLNNNISTGSNINIYSHNSNNWIEKSIKFSGLNMKPVYTYINGMLKISDANFDSGNTSRLFYYLNSVGENGTSYNTGWYDRENPLASPPSVSIGEAEYDGILEQTFDALAYSNNVTYKDKFQIIKNNDGENTFETNWALDDLGGFGKFIFYHMADHANNDDWWQEPWTRFEKGVEPVNDRDLQLIGFGDPSYNRCYNLSLSGTYDTPTYADGRTYSSTQLQAQVPPFTGGWGDEVEINDDNSASGCTSTDRSPLNNTNPFYIGWAGDDGGVYEYIDMKQFAALNNCGNVAKVSFSFDYEIQSYAHDGIYSECPHPYFTLEAGAWNSGMSSKESIILGESVDWDYDYYRASTHGNSGNFYENDEIIDWSSDEENNISWDNSTDYPFWDYSQTDNEQGFGYNVNHISHSGKTFVGELTFPQHGAYEAFAVYHNPITPLQDMILKFQIHYPISYRWSPNTNGVSIALLYKDNEHHSETRTAKSERIIFNYIKVHFYDNDYDSALLPVVSADLNSTHVNFNFSVPQDASGLGWEGRIFKLATTAVNMFDEESHLKVNSEDIPFGLQIVDVGEAPSIRVYIGHGVVTDSYRKKIKYYMKDTESNIWFLQFWVDLENLTIHTTTSNYSSNAINDIPNKTYFFEIPREKMINYNEVDSYESQTLISQDIAEGAQANLVCDYKTAVVANNRLYVGNIRQNGRLYGDRMIKSPIGKYNLLPSSNFIDVAINDGDEITALEFYKDKLLQFKKNKVFIINTSGDYEFLEDTVNNIGVSLQCQVTKTPYGIAWINKKGCFLYDGEKVENLIRNKISIISDESSISKNYWRLGSADNTDFTNIGSVGYNETSKEIVVKAFIDDKTDIVSEPDGYIYHIPSKSWYFTNRGFMGYMGNSDSGDSTNFATDKDGNLMLYLKNAVASYDDINDILKWDSSVGNDEVIATQKGIASASHNFRLLTFTTADITFGDVSVRKKIYKVYVTFKSVDSDGAAAHSKVLVKHATNGSASFTEFDNSSTNYSTGGNGLTDGASSTGWITAELKPSSSINNIYSFQLQFAATTAYAVGFEINDISIVYREKPVK